MTVTNSFEKLDPQDPRWFDFIQSREDAVIFHHPAWIKTLAQTYQYHPFILAACDDHGKILAGLPVMEVNSWLTGRRWVSLPFSDYCNPLALKSEIIQDFTDQLVSLHQQPDTPRIELRWHYPQRSKIETYTQHVLHLNRFEKGSREIDDYIHTRLRKRMNRAQNSGMQVEIGATTQDVDKFYNLQLNTRKRHGVPAQPRKFFNLLQENILQHGIGKVLTAYYQGRLLAGLVILWYQGTLTMKYSADTRDYDDLFPNYLLDYTAMRWAAENGFKTIDFGRSAITNEGLRSYKDRLGATEIPLMYSVINGKPPVNTSGNLSNIMEKVIQHSPTFVCRVAGEVLYRHVG